MHFSVQEAIAGLWAGARDGALRLCPDARSRLVFRAILMMVVGMDEKMKRCGAATIKDLHAALRRLHVTAASAADYQRVVEQLPELIEGLERFDMQRSAEPVRGRRLKYLVTENEGDLGRAVAVVAAQGPAGVLQVVLIPSLSISDMSFGDAQCRKDLG
jgi:hypothetical protein